MWSIFSLYIVNYYRDLRAWFPITMTYPYHVAGNPPEELGATILVHLHLVKGKSIAKLRFTSSKICQFTYICSTCS